MRMALMMAATAAYAQDSIFGVQSPKLDTPKGNIPSDNRKCQPKAQHEFTIKGVKIMAASKKDATRSNRVFVLTGYERNSIKKIV